MKSHKPGSASSAGATTVTPNSLPPDFDLQNTQAIQASSMPPDGSNPEHALRIAQKLRVGGSWTADLITCVRQSKVGSKSRTKALTQLIAEILRSKPGIKNGELLTELRRHERHGVIETVSDDEIEWNMGNGIVQTTKVSNLKNFISSAEKLLKDSVSG